MNTPINLNTVRKTRAKAARKTRAQENSVTFGQNKEQKAALKSQANKAARTLDGHKRET